MFPQQESYSDVTPIYPGNIGGIKKSNSKKYKPPKKVTIMATLPVKPIFHFLVEQSVGEIELPHKTGQKLS